MPYAAEGCFFLIVVGKSADVGDGAIKTLFGALVRMGLFVGDDTL